ncbi:MAG: helicase-related protein, partial [Deferrisomatales bacterium]
MREDGNEDDVFALIDPMRYDVPWKTLEARGFIAEALCTEYRIGLPPEEELAYAHAEKRNRFRIASENSKKVPLAEELIANHPDDHILVIGQYLAQLELLAEHLGLPLITGKTRHEERERLYHEFRAGRLRALVVSKLANFAVDLPDANVRIEVSGMFGSRQEEAQRLGRILRRKHRPSHSYALVSRGTDERRFAVTRQLLLVEQRCRCPPPPPPTKPKA